MGEVTVKDIRGQEIKPGDTIAFPDRRGSHMWLNTAVVREIDERDEGLLGHTPILRVVSTRHQYGEHEQSKRVATITKLDRAVKVC